MSGIISISHEVQAAAKADTPDIFSSDADGHLHAGIPVTTSRGEKYILRDVQIKDLPFYQALGTNPVVQQKFGNGRPALEAKIADRVKIWVNRWEQGLPHGALTVDRYSDRKPVGYVVAGAGDEAGISEVAYKFDPDCWNKGVGTAAVGGVVKEWAPAVKASGVKCFEGQPLRGLYATAKPSNVASWKLLMHNGFKPCIRDGLPMIDLSGLKIDGANPRQYNEQLERHLVDNYFNNGIAAKDKLYKLVIPTGEVFTVSYMSDFDNVEYHFELEI